MSQQEKFTEFKISQTEFPSSLIDDRYSTEIPKPLEGQLGLPGRIRLPISIVNMLVRVQRAVIRDRKQELMGTEDVLADLLATDPAVQREVIGLGYNPAKLAKELEHELFIQPKTREEPMWSTEGEINPTRNLKSVMQLADERSKKSLQLGQRVSHKIDTLDVFYAIADMETLTSGGYFLYSKGVIKKMDILKIGRAHV